MGSIEHSKAHNLIRTPDHRLRVFISSTMKELAEEREMVRRAILKLRLVPVMFEAGARPHPARELYQAYLLQSHVFIGIYWQSYGWVGPGMAISGLEDEYNLSAELPRLIYIKNPAPLREEGLTRMLDRIQNENTASYKRYATAAELGEVVENDLALLLTESFEAAHTALSAEFAPRPLTNLPLPRNPILGRERELETVCNWLARPEVALVTLTGAGGTGKSRLALEVAHRIRDDFTDGVYLVRLAPLNAVERVLPAIAETLGLHENAQGRPVEEILVEFLRNRRILLLLDNFEQVLGAAVKISELLEKCTLIKILVSSRAPLKVRTEREFQIQPLAIPAWNERKNLQSLSQYSSVALFIQRAQSLKADFCVTNENAPAVAEICSRLDGLPLAIELAAARIKLLPPQEILARLGNRFDLLRDGTRDLPERQQTMRGTIDWSYNLLSESERALFRRLAVFAGGWTLDAAESICNVDADLGPGILEEMESLVNFSLLTQTEDREGHLRFGMLETIREYAYERLVQSGEAGRLHRIHTEYFYRFAVDVEPRIRTAERARWRQVMERELENIRAALRWSHSAASGDAHIGLKILIDTGYFWVVCGYLREIEQYMASAEPLSNDASAPMDIRAGIKFALGGLALLHGENEKATPFLLEGVQLARQAGNRTILGSCLLWNGSNMLTLMDLPSAEQQLQDAISVFREIEDEWSQVPGLLWLSNVYMLQGKLEKAAEVFDASLALAYKQGDPWCLVTPLIDVAQRAFFAGDLDKAGSTLLQIESILRIVGDMWTLSWVLNALGQVAMARGDFGTAGVYFVESLELGREHGNMIVLAFSLAEAALVILNGDSGDETRRASMHTKAASLCGAVMPFFDHPILFSGRGLKDLCTDMIGRAQAQVEEMMWNKGFAEGRSMPQDQALALAMQAMRGA